MVAKSTKKPSRKIAKKVAKKTAPKAVKKSSKKVAQKPAKKVAKKAAKKPVKRPARKALPNVERRTGKRFLVIYHAPVYAMAQTANVSPEQQAAGMALWKAWAERVGSKLSDLGAPLVNGTRLSAEGSSNPSTREVAGYSMLEAGNLEEVLELLQGHPHLSGWHPEATIEIHETMLLPGM